MIKRLKTIYNYIPFKKEAFCLIRYFNLPEAIFKHLIFKGIFKVKVENNSFKMFHYGFQLENELFWKGINSWEKESLRCWINEAKNSNIIFDIGANTGIYSLIAKSVNSNADVYAFEPVERVFEKFNKNVELNILKIKTYCLAISDKTGVSKIWDYKSEHEYAASLVMPHVNPDIYISYNVQTITLDDFIEQNKIPKIDLIKIDVETHEPMVLEGYSRYFKIHKPKILIEVLYDNIGENIQSFIEKSEIFYNYYFIDEQRGLIKVNDIKRRSDKYFNYLLVPKNISL
ncbi:MAG: hypothetical protein Fur0028_01260 [Bacteroidales bacterium]